MPNQRKAGMVQIGGYFKPELKLMLQAEAARRKIGMTQLLKDIFEAAVDEFYRNNKKRAALGKSSNSTSPLTNPLSRRHAAGEHLANKRRAA
jgi:hypothetical protein